MPETRFSRRHFLSSAAIAGLSTPTAVRAAVDTGSDERFAYEVTRTDADWRARLSQTEFRILREGGTEPKHSSPLVNEARDGTYHCRGCDLTLYDGFWKVPLEIGWVFFRHARPDAILTAIDGERTDDDGNDISILAAIEAHCRRCGSHLGHIVQAEGQLVHCINGSSLAFRLGAA